MLVSKHYTQNFTFTSRDDIQTISDILQFIEKKASEFKASRKESILMCEEAIVKLLKYADFQNSKNITAEVSARKFMGNVNFTFRIPGSSFDFLKSLQVSIIPDTEELSPDVGDAINNILLQSFKSRLKYSHKNGFNYLRITALKSPYAALVNVLEAIALALITGLLLKNYASTELCQLISENVLDSIRSTLTNALKICAVPLVFFSLVTSISRFGDLGDMRRLGLRCMSYLFTAQTLSALIAVAVFFMLKPLFSSSAGILSELVQSGDAAEHSSILVEILSNLVPASFLSPFLDSNVLQLLLMGIMFGIAVKASGAANLLTIIDECSTVFTKLLLMVMKFIPLLVFCSITDTVLSSGFTVITRLAGLAVMVMLGYLAMSAIYCLAVSLSGCMSVSSLLRGSVSAMLTAASVLSGRAVILSNMEACENLGVLQKVYSISVPMALIFNKNGNCIMSLTSALFLAMMCGIEVSAVNVISFVIYALIIIMSASGFTAFLVIPAFLGVPMAAVELIIGITQILDIPGIALDSLGTVAPSVLIAGKENIRPAEI